MKKFSSVCTLLAMLVLAACNSGGEKTTTSTTTDTTTKVAAPDTPAAPVFKPFDVVEIRHSVKDYAKWKPLFETDSTARKSNGMEFIVIGRKNDKPNDLVVVLQASDVQKAKAFAADPRLKEVMKKGGVNSKPEASYYHVIRFNPNSKEKQWVLVTHKVKDFDAWLKVFDAEGTATRESFGLVDVALARGIDDPNVVHIVFDIKDMAKAKARMNAPELKKLMTDAGVEGAPKFEFYTTGE
jgi:hypothetical protein